MPLSTCEIGSIAHNCTHITYIHISILFAFPANLKDMVARTNIVSRQGEAVTVGSLNPLTFNEAVASVQDGRHC